MIDHEHFVYLCWFSLGLTSASIVGLFIGWKARRRPLLERVALATLPASGFVVLTSAVLIGLKAPEIHWNGCRLAPSMGLWYGAKLYRGPTSGPVLNTIYPPMSFVAYAPAGLCARPSTAVIVGSCVSMMLFYTPYLVLCLAPRPSSGPGRILLGECVFLGFCTLAMTSGTLFSSAHWIHSDAPAIGFAAGACLALHLFHERARLPPGAALASCLCASLAVWSKQTMAPLFVVLPLWVLATRGAAACARFGSALLGILALVSAAFRSAFGSGALVFNTLKIPARHRWYYEGDAAWMGRTFLSLELLYECLPVIVLIGLALAIRDGTDDDREDRGWSGWLSGNPWMLFAAAALAQAPMSLLGKIKIGGAINSDAPPHYLLCCALGSILLDRRSAGNRARNGALALVLAASIYSPIILINQRIIPDIKSLRHLSETGDEVAFQFARTHPGEAYFPWNPLASLLAERRLYHFEYGMIDRDRGGYPIAADHFLRHVPEQIRLVCFPPDRQSEWTMKYLPAFSRRLQIPELPGWICYTR